MKNYLLTWYGITDLNAALGFEEHGGPILGSLRAGDYSDVLILAYAYRLQPDWRHEANVRRRDRGVPQDGRHALLL